MELNQENNTHRFIEFLKQKENAQIVEVLLVERKSEFGHVKNVVLK